MSKVQSQRKRYFPLFFGSLLVMGILAGSAYFLGSSLQLHSLMQVGIFQIFCLLVTAVMFGVMGLLKGEDNPLNSLGRGEIYEKDVPPVIRSRFKLVVQKLSKFYLRYGFLMLLCVFSILGFFSEKYIYDRSFDTPLKGNLAILVGMGSFLIAFVYMLATNWIVGEGKDLENITVLGIYYRGVQWFALFCGLAIIIKGLGFSMVEYYLVIFIFFSTTLIFLETVVCAVVRLFLGVRDEGVSVRLYFVPAFLSGSNPVTNIMNSIEDNMGISLRSLWAINIVRHSIGPLLLIIILLFWGMTGVVQIGYDEQGIIYNLGRIINAKPLEAGIYWKWPWPIETVKKFAAYRINHFTVGYEESELANNDFLWSRGHGGEEYPLVLGNGRELVAINMKVFYKIDDIFDYALNYQKPEQELQARAYRILLQEIANTDLDTFLSINRESFARLFRERLQKISDEEEFGLEVVNIALASIHPPIDIANEYQNIVSTQIQKQIIIKRAIVEREASLPNAEKERANLITDANISALNRRSEINSEVTQFTYQRAAYSLEPELYLEWRWLEKLEGAITGKKIYLLDEESDVQRGEIWLDFRN